MVAYFDPNYGLVQMICIQGHWISLLEWIYTPDRANLKEVQIWKEV